MITLKQLQHMLAVVECGSVQAAAERLHLTAPALSRSLATLEERLSVTLFDRSKGGMLPTAFCLTIHDRCQALLAEAGDIEREARLYRQLESGQLSIGVGRAIREWVLQQVIPAFFRQYPNIALRVTEGLAPELVHGLKQRQLDLVLAGYESYRNVDGLQFEHIADIPMPVMVRPGHPLLDQQPASPARLAEYPYFATTRASPDHPLLKRFRDEYQVALQPRVLCSDYTTLHRLLVEHDGWMPGPAPQFAAAFQAGELQRLAVTGWDLAVRLSAIEITERSRAPAACQLVQLCRDILAGGPPPS